MEYTAVFTGRQIFSQPLSKKFTRDYRTLKVTERFFYEEAFNENLGGLLVHIVPRIMTKA